MENKKSRNENFAKELYSYCKERGYEGTFDEFQREINFLADEKNLKSVLSDSELSEVAGGASSEIRYKIIAGVLSAAILASSSMAPNAYAVRHKPTHNQKSSSIKSTIQNVSNKIQSMSKKQIAGLVGIIGGGVAVGTTVGGLGIGGLLGNADRIVDAIKKPINIQMINQKQKPMKPKMKHSMKSQDTMSAHSVWEVK